MMAKISAHQISRGTARRQRQIENGKHSSAPRDGKRDGNQRGSDSGVAGLANADDGVTEQKLPVVIGKPGEDGEAAPDDNAEHHNVLAAKHVPQPSQSGGGD